MIENGWRPKAIIFDMDGLLVDSEPVWALAEAALVASYGKRHDPRIQKQLIGLGPQDYLSRMAAAYGIAETVENLRVGVIERMRALIPQKVLPRPGAPEMVAYVVERDLPRAIASSSPMTIIDAIIASQGWSEIFLTRCSGDEVTNGKPAPDVYLLAAERLGVAPGECLALEDSPTGAQAAVAAGMVCCAVPDGSHTDAAAFRDITDLVFGSLHDVLPLLE